MSIYSVTFSGIYGCFLGLFPYSRTNDTASFGNGVGGHDGQGTLDLALRTLRGDAHDRARRHGGECGVARDPGRPWFHTVGPCVGRKRVPDLLRRPAPARRAARGSHLPQGDVPGRPRGVYVGFALVWAGPEPGIARRGAIRSGCRRGD